MISVDMFFSRKDSDKLQKGLKLESLKCTSWHAIAFYFILILDIDLKLTINF